MLATLGWILAMGIGTAAIVWGAELFAEHLAAASARLGVTTFALALLLAGAEPEELATVAAASARGVDGVAFGDVIGANAAIVTVALAAGAFVATMPFGERVRRYGLGGLVAAILGGAVVWDGHVGRLEGLLLVAGYVAFVGAIWFFERRPPALGETGELEEQRDTSSRFGRDIALVIGGLAAITGGSVALVEGVRQLSGVESTQTRLGLIIVGFATAFELVALAWSSARRGISDAVVAGVVGSYAYNVTMSLGVGALIDPITIADRDLIQAPYVVMVALMVLVLALSKRGDQLRKPHGWALLLAYPGFIAVAMIA